MDKAVLAKIHKHEIQETPVILSAYGLVKDDETP